MTQLARILQELISSFRFSWRRLRRAPLFAITTVATFALGIAANSAIFSVMEALVLRPLAVPHLNQVVSVAEQHGAEYPSAVSLPDYLDYAQRSHSFRELAARTEEYRILTLSGQSEHIHATRSTLNLFALFQIEPLLGRVFAAGEDRPGRDGAVVLTHAFWQSHYGGNASALGSELVLDGHPYTIVGVLPRSFDHVSSGDLYLPLAPTATQENDRKTRDYTMVGRLRDGVSVASATAELNGVAAGIAQQFPTTNEGWHVRVRPLVETINGDLTPVFLRLVLAATWLLMIVVCANISNLQFAYTLRRAPELAMRFALGSTRRRLLGELLIDSVAQSLLGAVLGLLLAQVALHFMLAEMPAQVAVFLAGWNEIHLDWRTVAYSVAVAVAAGVIAGIAPALAGARVQLLDQLKSGGRSVSGSRRSHRLRNLLSGAQIALATGLVAGAACIAASMRTIVADTARYAPGQALVFDAYLPATRYATAAQQSAFLHESLDRLSALPAVHSAVFTTGLPYDNTGVLWRGLQIAGDPALPGQARSTQQLTVSPGFFDSFGIARVGGRTFTSTDSLDHPLVAVISRRLAQLYFGDRDPVGRQIQTGTDTTLTAPATIVGIVDDVIYPWVDQVPQPTVYFSSLQLPTTVGTYVLRTSGDPMSLAPAARRTLAAMDATLPVDPPETYASFLHQSLIGLSYVAVMLAVDAGIALILSAIGLFGVMTNLVTERTQEIGIRFAVGADRSSVMLLLMRRSFVILGAGLLAGVAVAVGIGRILVTLLENVRALQLEILLISSALIALIGLIAGYLPSRRAATVDPVRALRTN